MPFVLLGKDQQRRWLEADDSEEILALLSPRPDDIFRMYAVSTQVNSPGNNYAGLHEEVGEKLRG